MEEQIVFKLLDESDLILLSRWLKEPHVKKVWQETDDFSLLRNKFIEEHPRCGVDSFIIYYDHEPIGYIQCYQADKSGQGWWIDAEPGVYGIDFFIGEYKMIGKGIGTQIMRKFISELCKKSGIKKIIVDPTPNNVRMIHICEKIGFSNKGAINTPDGQAILLELKI